VALIDVMTAAVASLKCLDNFFMEILLMPYQPLTD